MDFQFTESQGAFPNSTVKDGVTGHSIMLTGRTAIVQLFVSVRRESQDTAPRSRSSVANEESNERAQWLHFRRRARRRAAVPRPRSASQQHC